MKFGVALLVAISMLGAGASAAAAADSIYWANYDSNAISAANLDGSGSGRDLFSTGDLRGGSVGSPTGLTLNPAAGSIYWANSSTPSITRASIDSCAAATTCASDIYPLGVGGPPVSGPGGPALDAAHNLMYWINDTGVLVRTSLDGSGAVNDTVDTTGASPEGGGGTGGIAIDPSSNRIYWTSDDFAAGTISWANLDGSGGGDLNTTGANMGRPWGLAIDTASNKIYWANYNGAAGGLGSISWANLDGSGGGDLYTSASPGCAMIVGPDGVAIDHAANKIYWANYDGSTISSANLDGSGGCTNISTTGATMDGPDEVVVLRAPVATAAPVLSGTAKTGSTLSCSAGSWGGDSTEAGYYRAPRTTSYQWEKDGAVIAGATAATFTPSSTGSYVCAVVATNSAGSTTNRAGAAIAVKRSVRLAKPKFKHKTKRGKLLLTSAISPVASPALSSTDCAGRVSLKFVLKKKKIASKSFALKYKRHKCSAAISLKVAKKYAGKRVKLTLSIVRSTKLTTVSKTLSVKL